MGFNMNSFLFMYSETKVLRAFRERFEFLKEVLGFRMETAEEETVDLEAVFGLPIQIPIFNIIFYRYLDFIIERALKNMKSGFVLDIFFGCKK